VIQILCQACAAFPASKGCATCGGLKVLLRESCCPLCRRPHFIRPGVYTNYDGKRWTTFDGVEMVDRIEGSRCLDCDKKERKP
jgi:hypothetical protein